MYPKPIPPSHRKSRILYMTGVWAVLAIWLLPVAAIIMTSFRTFDDIMAGNYWGWPTKFNILENYAAIFQQTDMLVYFRNSLIITVPSVVLVLALSTMTGFVLSRHKFVGSTLLFAAFIAGNFMPYQVFMIPVRDLMVSLGLYDTYGALILFHVSFQLGFATLFMRNFIAALPGELFQAARAEGASPMQILRIIVVPLVRPALAALAILLFTFIWNDYFWAIVLTQTDAVKPVTAGLANLRGEWVSAWNVISAATLFVAIPPVLMFFLMQKHFVSGLTMGAVKG